MVKSVVDPCCAPAVLQLTVSRGRCSEPCPSLFQPSSSHLVGIFTLLGNSRSAFCLVVRGRLAVPLGLLPTLASAESGYVKEGKYLGHGPLHCRPCATKRANKTNRVCICSLFLLGSAGLFVLFQFCVFRWLFDVRLTETPSDPPPPPSPPLFVSLPNPLVVPIAGCYGDVRAHDGDTTFQKRTGLAPGRPCWWHSSWLRRCCSAPAARASWRNTPPRRGWPAGGDRPLPPPPPAARPASRR